MAPGDVVVQIVDATTAAVDTAVTNMRGASTDTWMMVSIGLQNESVLIVNITEA